MLTWCTDLRTSETKYNFTVFLWQKGVGRAAPRQAPYNFYKRKIYIYNLECRLLISGFSNTMNLPLGDLVKYLAIIFNVFLSVYLYIYKSEGEKFKHKCEMTLKMCLFVLCSCLCDFAIVKSHNLQNYN